MLSYAVLLEPQPPLRFTLNDFCSAFTTAAAYVANSLRFFAVEPPRIGSTTFWEDLFGAFVVVVFFLPSVIFGGFALVAAARTEGDAGAWAVIGAPRPVP